MVEADSTGHESRTSRLVRAARTDGARVAEIYTRVVPALFTWAALRIPPALRARLDPEDIVQETWVRAFERFAAFDPDLGSFRASHLRQRRARATQGAVRDAPAAALVLDSHDVPDEATSVSRRFGRDEAVRELIGVFARLDEEERQIVVHRGLEERPFTEIAALLGIQEAAARKRWQRVRERLAGLVPDGILVDGE